MTDLLSDVDAPSDAELISRVRGGDVAAYGDLFSRHKDAAGRLARQLVRGPDSDDLVSEAFAKVLHVLQGGGGPDVSFRAYLLTAVRRLHVDRIRSGQRLQTTDDMTPFDPGVPFQDTAVAGFESGAAAKAFASLPERWQLVLWHLEVEGQKPADIAPLLGMSANSVSALAYRAREGLRQAFLTMHIADLTETDCRWVNEHLGGYIRKGLSKRDTGNVTSHLDGCRRCTAMYLELTEVNSNLAGIIAPLLLGAAASGYLASSGASAAGVLGLLSRIKDFAAANSGAVTAAGVAAGVATAAAVAAITLSGGGSAPRTVVADPAAPVSTPAPSLPRIPDTKPPKSAGPAVAILPPVAQLLLPPVAQLVPPPKTPSITASTDPVVPAPDLTDPVPTDPTPGTAASSSVDVSGTTIDSSGVHFVAVGTPTLPPTLTVRLLSDPDGVVFTQVGNDCAVAGDGLSAVCTTVAGSGARTPGTVRMAAASSYSAELPFDQDLGPDVADVSLSVGQLPDGFELSTVDSSILSYHYTRLLPVRQVDVALVSLAPSIARPGPGDTYTLHAMVSVNGSASSEASTIRYTITGGSFVPGDGCTATECTLTATGAPTFLVTPTDPATISTVGITAHAPAGLQDTDPSNDTAAVTLQRYDLSLTGLAADPGRADALGDQTFTATLGADGFPTPADLTYAAVGGQLVSTSRIGAAVTFVVRSTSGEAHDVTISVGLPSGYTDRVPGDNTAGPATWTPSDEVDLTFGGTPATVRPGPGDLYAVAGTLDVAGPARARVHQVTYTVTGAQFVEGGVPTSTATRQDDLTPSFVLSHLGAVTATITASAPGFTETSSADNTRSVQLAPYDVALGPLTASTPSADQSGVQTFTATVTTDGFGGPLAYSLTGPADLSMTPSVAGSTATFTVHSSLRDQTPVGFTVRADLPAGYTDYATTDNSAGGTYSYATTPFTIASAVASDRVGGEWSVTATLTGVPQGASVAFGLISPSEFVSATGCTISNANHTLTCPSTSTRPFSVTFRAKLPGAQNQQHGTLEAGVVGDPTRTASTTITD